MTLKLKITPMHPWHKDQGANMADFAGYDMPLWYNTGVKKEHFSVLQTAGIFDTSHMACISVMGQDALKLLDDCFTRNLSQLLPMRCTYGAFLDVNGYCIDDAIIYKFNDTTFMVCVNAGMGPIVTRHLVTSLGKNKNTVDVTIKDLSGQLAKIDIQGPQSVRLLSRLIQDADTIFKTFPYFSFKGCLNETFSPIGLETVKLKDNTPILLSRSGYTGEFGFEIFISPDAALNFWETILNVGIDFGTVACGLGARDSLRTGACLPLSHQDIGKYKFHHHPWKFALPYNADKTGFTKSFIGDNALLNNKDTFFTLPFVGDSLRKIGTGNQSQVFHQNDKPIGHVLSCATDMAIGWLDNKIVSINTPNLPENFKIKGLSCGFIRVSEKLSYGTKVTLIEKKRTIDVTIVDAIRPDMTARKKINNFI